MNREEQIMNDPNLACYVDKQRGWIHEAFMDGVRWADETMIDKVCKWLKDNIEEFVHGRDWDLDKEDLTACLRAEIYEEV